jgi:hypothetical protein
MLDVAWWREKLSEPDWWVAGGTVTLAFVTSGLWYATWRLWRSTRAALSDARTSSDAAIQAATAATAQVKEASRSADAMQASAGHMEALVRS